jgi:hypothetical protein
MIPAAPRRIDIPENPNRRRLHQGVLALEVARAKGPVLQPLAPAVQNARAGAR